ncbi:MAG: DUF6259 domain-containing protein [Nanoarchaeota archaeon]|nr:DUF6259 domain-containing protein [Nanoarchaeota archaeon]
MKIAFLFTVFIVLVSGFVFATEGIDDGSNSKEAVYIENNYLSLKFEMEGKAVQLMSVTNKETDYIFEFDSSTMWKMKIFDVKKPSGENDFVTDSYAVGSNCEKVTYDKNKLGSTEKLTFKWDSCELADGEFADIDLAISLEDSEKNSRWRINVDNNMLSHSIDYITLPFKIKKDSTQNTYAVDSTETGWLIRNPANTINEPKSRRSNGVQMQLSPYYTENGDGLYMATNDPYGTYLKRQDWDADGASFTHEFGHYVEGSASSGNDLVLPYDLLVGVYEGEWYDAAKIYRQWAQQTPMLSRGKLKTRSDVPQWHKDLDLITLTALQNYDNYQQHAQKYNDAQEFYGADNEMIFAWFWTNNPTGSNHPDYGKYTPKNNFPNFLNSLNGYGIKSTVYSLTFAIDKNIPQWNALEHTVLLDRNGNMMRAFHNEPDAEDVVVVDVSNSDWQSNYAGLASNNFIAIGASGNYFDNPYASWFGDFNEEHNYHPLGMGGNYIYNGYAELMGKVRNAGRGVNPNYITFYEREDEKYIRVSDTVGVSGIYDPPVIGDDINTVSIPLFPTVYHDYAVMISNPKVNYLINGYTNYGDVTFTLAKGVILGAVPTVQEAAYELGLGLNYELGNHPGYEVLGGIISNYAKFYKDIISLRKSVRDYLTYGELLRELPTDSPNVVKKFCFDDSTNPSNCPDSKQNRVHGKEVLNSVWRSYQGDIGFFFLNYNDNQKTVNANVDFNDYGLDVGTDYVLKRYTSDGNVVEVMGVSDDFSFTETFAPRSAVFFTLTEGVMSSEDNDDSNGGSGGGGGGGSDESNGNYDPSPVIKKKVSPVNLEKPKDDNEDNGDNIIVTSRKEDFILGVQKAVFGFLSGLVAILIITAIIIYTKKIKPGKKRIH